MKLGRTGTLADGTLRYIVATRPLHDRLRQVATQAAGFSLLVMTRGTRVPMLDAPLALAAGALRAARDELRALPVPPEARHHHRHLAAATDALAQSLELLAACLRPAAGEATCSALVRGLRLATEHLRSAARLLPGFEMTDLAQSCCAAHAAPRPMACG